MKQALTSHSEQRTQDLANGTPYGLRTEFRGDCEPIFMILKPWLVDWFESDGMQINEDVVAPKELYWANRNWGIDTDVKFVVKAGGPSLNEIRWLINSVQDCHVAAQTVEPLGSYTGERMHYELFDETATRPGKEVLEAALASIATLQNHIEVSGERAANVKEYLQAHIGNPKPYMQKVAIKQATQLIKYGVIEDINCTQLAEVLYQNMTFDSNGTHVRLPGFKD